MYEDKYINILDETNKVRENETNSKKMHIFINMGNDCYTKMKNMTGFKTSLKKVNIAITIELDALADKFNRIKKSRMCILILYLINYHQNY